MTDRGIFCDCIVVLSANLITHPKGRIPSSFRIMKQSERIREKRMKIWNSLLILKYPLSFHYFFLFSFVCVGQGLYEGVHFHCFCQVIFDVTLPRTENIRSRILDSAA